MHPAKTADSTSTKNNNGNPPPPQPSMPKDQPNFATLLGPSAKLREARGNTLPPENIESLQSAIRSKEASVQFKFKKTQYKFLRVLGSGTYATVSEAVWLPKDLHVAVKVIDKRRLVDHEESLFTEIRILAECSHPNLLKMLDWGMGSSSVYLVTELARGGELFDRIVELGFLYERDVGVIIRRVLEAVQYLHSKNIIHRDLKPENIFLRDPTHRDFSDIVIGDFGISRFLDQSHRAVNTCTGSYGYMAPEVLMQSVYGKPCDLWSIGVVTYVLMTGMSPYPTSGCDFDEELEAILARKLTFSEPYWCHISKEGKDFTAKLLRINPKNRPTAEEALQHPWIQRAREFESLTKQQSDGDISNHKDLPRHEHRYENEEAKKKLSMSPRKPASVTPLLPAPAFDEPVSSNMAPSAGTNDSVSTSNTANRNFAQMTWQRLRDEIIAPYKERKKDRSNSASAAQPFSRSIASQDSSSVEKERNHNNIGSGLCLSESVEDLASGSAKDQVETEGESNWSI